MATERGQLEVEREGITARVTQLDNEQVQYITTVLVYVVMLCLFDHRRG